VIGHVKRLFMHIALWMSPGNLGSWERLACSRDFRPYGVESFGFTGILRIQHYN